MSNSRLNSTSMSESSSQIRTEYTETKNRPFSNNICISSSWKLYNNIFVPVLIVRFGNHDQLLFWSDDISFVLSKEMFCTRCGKESVSQPCITCQASIQWKKFSCILEGAGKPFQEDCIFTDPPCGDSIYAKNVCFSEYIVYIGKKSNNWKIGISRYNRNSVDSGFLLRLIEQGIEEAIILRRSEKLNLKTAQYLEKKLSLEFNIPETLFSKFSQYSEKKMGHNYGLTIERMSTDIKSIYPDLEIESFHSLNAIGIFNPWLARRKAEHLIRTSNTYKIEKNNYLHFRVLATLGETSLIKVKGKYCTFKRKMLAGRKITGTSTI